MSVLKCENVSKKFGEHLVLDDVSLEIKKGSFVSIVGASGSGKSTLLTILGGIDKPTEGKVYLGDREISSMTEKELAILRRTDLGFVFNFTISLQILLRKKTYSFPLCLPARLPTSIRHVQKSLWGILGFWS